MNNSTYITIDDHAPCRYAVSIFFTTALAITSLASIIGNILVIVTVCKTPSLRTSTNFYYVNMAVSDLISCIITWPLYLADESSESLLRGSSIECKAEMFFRMVSMIVSILSLVLIAVDRFIATVFPLRATLITRKFRAALLCATWLISIAYCIPLFYFFSSVQIGQETLCKTTWNDFPVIVYSITGFVLFEIIPFITIIVLYSRIMRVLRQILVSECNTASSNTEQNRIKQSQNIMKIFKSIVAVLFTLFSLFSLYIFFKMFSPELFIKDRCKLIEGFAFYLFPTLSTSTNPVILFAFSSNFRKTLPGGFPSAFGKFLPCRKVRTRPLQHENQTLPVAYEQSQCWISNVLKLIQSSSFLKKKNTKNHNREEGLDTRS